NSLFFLLSTSAMVEMPTIAAAMIAVNCAGARRFSKFGAALIGGLAMGIAAQVKLTALLYVPACLALNSLRFRESVVSPGKHEPLAIGLFAAGMGVSFLVIAGGHPGEISSLLPHFGQQMRTAFAEDRSFQ